MRFDDYHGTVVGYHGTGLATALRIGNRVEGFRWSRRDFDWLGHGIYFWKYRHRATLELAKPPPLAVDPGYPCRYTVGITVIGSSSRKPGSRSRAALVAED